MKTKESLAILSANLSLPLSEYIQLDAATALSKQVRLIEKIEPYHLPEISKLICGTDNLLNHFSPTYNEVCEFYKEESVKTVQEKLSDSSLPEEYYTKNIFPYASEEILKNFVAAFHGIKLRIANANEKKTEYEKQLKSLTDEKQSSLNEIEQLERERDVCSENDTQSETLARIDERTITVNNSLKRFDEKINTLNKKKLNAEKQVQKFDEILKRHSFIKEEIEKLIVDLKKNNSEKRKIVYSLFNNKQEIESYIQAWTETGNIDPTFVENLKSNDYCDDFVTLLEVKQNDTSLCLLDTLYDHGAIDIRAEAFHNYLLIRPEIVCAFVIQRLNEASYEDDDNLSTWLDFLFDLSFKCKKTSVCHCDGFWNHISSENLWRYVLSQLWGYDASLFTDNIAKIILWSNLDTRKSLFPVIKERIEEKQIAGLSSLVTSLIQNHSDGDDYVEIIEYFIRQFEEKSESVQRQSKKYKAVIDRYPSDIYASLSEPVEALELLAADIDIDDDSLIQKIIAAQLKKDMLLLRKGLENIGVSPVGNPEDWKSRHSLLFDPKKHKISLSNPPHNVYLRSLGFQYKNAMGQIKTQPATVGQLQNSEIAMTKESPESVQKEAGEHE